MSFLFTYFYWNGVALVAISDLEITYLIKNSQWCKYLIVSNLIFIPFTGKQLANELHWGEKIKEVDVARVSSSLLDTQLVTEKSLLWFNWTNCIILCKLYEFLTSAWCTSQLNPSLLQNSNSIKPLIHNARSVCTALMLSDSKCYNCTNNTNKNTRNSKR